MDDIVTRLNNDAERCFITEVVRNYADAVDEIERLRELVRQLESERDQWQRQAMTNGH